MPVGAKRKRGAQKGGATSKKTRCSREEQEQYRQGVDILELSGMGCGTCLLITPGFTFQSPLDEVMTFEVMSGAKGPGTGGIRLCGPSKGPKDFDSPVFMVPFRHVEQIIIIDEPSQKGSSTDKAYRVIIVPTAAVGASALKRIYPKVISFTLPDQKADSDFQGTVGEAVEDPDETYRSLVTRVFNEQITPFKKSVVDATSAASPAAEEPGDRLMCDAVLKQESDTPKKAVKGKLFFLETGILFHSQTTVVYLTAESTPAAFLVSNFEPSSKRRGPASLTLVCPTSEPYYEKAQEGQRSASEQDTPDEPFFISFHDMSPKKYDKLAQYAKRHGITVNEVEQDWYSLKEDQPMTSWMPPGMMPRKR